jgi:hypothetical protein
VQIFGCKVVVDWAESEMDIAPEGMETVSITLIDPTPIRTISIKVSELLTKKHANGYQCLTFSYSNNTRK